MPFERPYSKPTAKELGDDFLPGFEDILNNTVPVNQPGSEKHVIKPELPKTIKPEVNVAAEEDESNVPWHLRKANRAAFTEENSDRYPGRQDING
jgi:hypothetical protein